MKRRALLAAALAVVLAVPLAATAWFSDVPNDHPHRQAVGWAREQGLFLGYQDGSFRPDEELSESQLRKVVERLFGKQDSWTRSDAAQFLFDGWNGPASRLQRTDSSTPPSPTVAEKPPLGNVRWEADYNGGSNGLLDFSLYIYGQDNPLVEDILLEVEISTFQWVVSLRRTGGNVLLGKWIYENGERVWLPNTVRVYLEDGGPCVPPLPVIEDIRFRFVLDGRPAPADGGWANEGSWYIPGISFGEWFEGAYGRRLPPGEMVDDLRFSGYLDVGLPAGETWEEVEETWASWSDLPSSPDAVCTVTPRPDPRSWGSDGNG